MIFLSIALWLIAGWLVTEADDVLDFRRHENLRPERRWVVSFGAALIYTLVIVIIVAGVRLL